MSDAQQADQKPRKAHLFKPGQCGNPNGRPKGGKNHYRFVVTEICKEQDCNPVEILCQIANGTLKTRDNKFFKITPFLRKEAAAELLQYCAPKLKSVEINNGNGESFNMTFNINRKKQDADNGVK